MVTYSYYTVIAVGSSQIISPSYPASLGYINHHKTFYILGSLQKAFRHNNGTALLGINLEVAQFYQFWILLFIWLCSQLTTASYTQLGIASLALLAKPPSYTLGIYLTCFFFNDCSDPNLVIFHQYITAFRAL